MLRLHFNVHASSWERGSPKVKSKIEHKRKITHKAMKKPAVGTKLRFMFAMMRLSQKANTWNKIDKNHWEENCWLGKERPWKS